MSVAGSLKEAANDSRVEAGSIFGLIHNDVGGEIQKAFIFDTMQGELYSSHTKQEASHVDETSSDP
jgi:hypothetical protein